MSLICKTTVAHKTDRGISMVFICWPCLVCPNLYTGMCNTALSFPWYGLFTKCILGSKPKRCFYGFHLLVFTCLQFREIRSKLDSWKTGYETKCPWKQRVFCCHQHMFWLGGEEGSTIFFVALFHFSKIKMTTCKCVEDNSPMLRTANHASYLYGSTMIELHDASRKQHRTGKAQLGHLKTQP